MKKYMKFWIKTKALFVSGDEADEIIGKTLLEEEDFCFKANEVIAFNRAQDGENTCVRMRSGFDINVCIPFDEFETVLESAIMGQG